MYRPPSPDSVRPVRTRLKYAAPPGPSQVRVDAIRPAPIVERHADTALYAPPLCKAPEPERRLERCPDCGHNIRVLFSPYCPGCGVNVVSALRRHQSNARVAFERVLLYREGLIYVIASYCILAFVLLTFGEKGVGTAGDVGWFMLRQSAFVPFAWALYAICNIAWFKSVQPFPVAMMGIMTAVAVSDTVGFFLWGVPVPFVPQLAVAVTLATVICKTLDLEHQESLLFGLLLGASRWMMHWVLAQGA